MPLNDDEKGPICRGQNAWPLNLSLAVVGWWKDAITMVAVVTVVVVVYNTYRFASYFCSPSFDCSWAKSAE